MNNRIIFMIPAILVAVVLASGQSASATDNTPPVTLPDPQSEGTGEWVYIIATGKLCERGNELSCSNVGEGRPCDEIVNLIRGGDTLECR